MLAWRRSALSLGSRASEACGILSQSRFASTSDPKGPEREASREADAPSPSAGEASSSSGAAKGGRKRGVRLPGVILGAQDASDAPSSAHPTPDEVSADPFARWGNLPTHRLHRPGTRYEKDLYDTAPPYREDSPAAVGKHVGHIISAEMPRPVLAWTPKGLRWKRGRSLRGRTVPIRALNLEVSYRLGTCIVLSPSWAFVANYPSVFPYSDTTIY